MTRRRTRWTEVYYRWLRDERTHLVLGSYGSGASCGERCRRWAGRGRCCGTTGARLTTSSGPGWCRWRRPASTYLVGAVRLCGRSGIDRIVIVAGKGPFAAYVARGARDEARRLGIEAKLVLGIDGVDKVDPDTAILVTAAFGGDLAVVERIRAGGRQPALLGCVAAGVPQFR